MENKLQIIFLEDETLDVARVRNELSQGGVDFELKQVITREEFQSELENRPDLILSDHGLPAFDGFAALNLVHQLKPQIPFILVTGALGEDMAVRAFKSGATDFVRKDRLQGLVPAVHRAMQFAQERRKRLSAEESLRTSEELFRLLVEGVTDYALCMLDSQGRVVTWNLGAERISGYCAEEIVGQSYARFFPADAIAKGTPQELLSEAIEAERSQEESWRVRKDGSRYYANMVLTPIREPTGILTGFAMVIRDVTERKTWERALRKSQALKTAILESALDAIVAMDGQGKILEWNPAAERIFGYTPQQAIGKDMAQLIVPPHLRERHREALAHYLTTHQSTYLGRRQEMMALRADHTEFPVELTVCRIQHEEPPLFTGFIRDITHRKAAEAALRKSEDQFRLAVEAAEDYGIYLLDTEGRMASWNAGAERIHGYHMEEVFGRSYSLFFLPEEVERGLPEQELEHARHFGVSRREAWGVRKDGSRYYSQWVLTAVRDPEGQLTGFLRVVHDITERRHAEEQITQLNAELEQRVRQRTAELQESNRELEAFSYSISHDLRAPLRHIDGFINLLRQSTESALDESSREYLQIISQEARQMNKLIEALLTFSRTSRAPLRKSRVELNTLLQVVLQDLRFDVEARQIDWVLSPLPEVQGDSSLLRQVLFNLLSNALKYTRPRERARIEVRAEALDHEIVVQVKDNGVGFNMAFADKLFGVFQRLHGPEEFEGIGIGLANVRRIIQRHGGRTWAEAAPDQGATFYFSLPK